MPKKSRHNKFGLLPRGLSASIAGLRAGGALAVDSALQKAMGNQDKNSAFAQREAQRFAQELGKLKGSYVKIGQMMALFGEHFLPSVLTEALHGLADNTPPLSWSELEPQVRDSLGHRYSELDIEREPLAAASLAQVHRATIKSSGEVICLKIQYPNLETLIDKDFDHVVRMLLLARWLDKSRELDQWLTTMQQHLKNEIDYAREIQLTQKMAQMISTSSANRAGLVELIVPTIYPDYCSNTVIGMSLHSGQSISGMTIEQLSLERRNRLAKSMLDLFFNEVFHWELLQTDPNFGNFLIQLGDDETGINDKLVLLDFGSAIEWPSTSATHLQNIIRGGLLADQYQIARGLRGLKWLSADASIQAEQLFVKFCQHLLEPLQPTDQLPTEHLNNDGKYRWGRSALIQRTGIKGTKNAASRHFSPPAGDFILVARKLTGVFTFIAVLDAEFNGCEISDRYLEESDNIKA